MLLSTLAAGFAFAAAPLELTVMTYNIRYGTAPDGVNAWPNRKEAVMGLLRKHDPDVLGVQEALAGQIDELQKALPGHEMIGVGRDDGMRKGEFSAIFVRAAKLGLRESGTRWISPEPERPGSLAFDAQITRIFTWGDCFAEGGTRLLVLNCHLDHQSQKARQMGGQHMRKFIDARPSLPAIVMGDFNSPASDPPVQTLVAKGRLTDLMPAEGPFGTFTAFKPEAIDGPMIDHILISKHWEPLSVEIDRTTIDGRVPSDHFPVIARVRLR
ncbi:MAG: endonuclease/exonuclease/phosphatase family protein [Chthonomonas sp.]|nr:endonuclease/exonuclease/phosphatase family protein [Chthonomonas sp.]